MSNHNGPSLPFHNKFSIQTPRPLSPQRPTSKILPFFSQKPASRPSSRIPSPDIRAANIHRFPAVGAAPYVPIRQYRPPYLGVAPPVTVRTAVPVFSAPPLGQVMQQVRMAPPVCMRQVVPAFGAPPCPRKDPPSLTAVHVAPEPDLRIPIKIMGEVDESTAVRCLQ